MLRNYIRTAIRNLVKDKYFSAMNIAGLALGISLCMVIIAIIKNQLSYDSFHPYVSRTFRINTEAIKKNGSTEDYATSPLPLSGYLKKNYPYVQDAVNLTGGLSGDASVNEKTIFINGFFSGPSFFKVFGFHLLYGDESNALNEPNSIILTNDAAKKLFGKTGNPVGRVLTIKGLQDFIVAGVLDDPPGKTHLEFDAIGSDRQIGTLEKSNKLFAVDNNWANYYSTYTYVVLKKNARKIALATSLADVSKTVYKNVQQEDNDKGYRFYAQAINKIVPGPILYNNMGHALPEELLWYLSIIGLVVIVSAGFNYNSLSLAKGLSRSKEIGIRKSVGARRHQLVYQFLVQSIVTCIAAMILAAALFHWLLRPFFEQMNIFQSAQIILYEDPALYVLFVIFSIIVGIISGVVPAFYLSSFNTLKVLKAETGFNNTPKLGFRKVLFVIQFGIALLFVVGLVNIYRQINHVLNADYGFQKDNVVNVNLRGNDYSLLKQQLSQVKGVKVVSASSHSMGTTQDRAVDVRVHPYDDKIRIRDFTVDDSYINNFGLHLIAGNNFSTDLSQNPETGIIVNETFLNNFRLGDPVEAIGKKVILGDSLNVSVIGVVKNFNFQPLTKAIAPLIFRYNIKDLAELNIRIDENDIEGTLTRLSKAWKKIDNTNAFKYSFLTDEMQKAYSSYESFPPLMLIVAVMSLVVAGLGLLGLSLFSLNQRIKEVCIRKILGATVPEITALLCKNFVRLTVTGVLTGLPLSIFLTDMFLKDFAYKINPYWGYLIAIGILAAMVFFTVGIQVISVARTNPAKSLRRE